MTDGQLLAEFARTGSEQAFAEIVGRHGRMVHGVCLRVTRRLELAEDATQAVFLVLARKAAGVAREPDAGGWLHRAAEDLARNAVRSEARRHAHEREAAAMRRPEAGTGAGSGAVSEHLDAEIARLPAAQRRVVVGLYLEGRTRAEMAQALGVPEGTVASRSAAAVEKLRERIERRGVALGSAALAAALSEIGGSVAVPASLASLPSLAAAFAAKGAAGAAGVGAWSLAEGAMKAMFWMKVKMAAAALAAAATVSTAVPVTVRVIQAAEEAEPLAETPAPAAEPAKEEVLEFRRLTEGLRGGSTQPVFAAARDETAFVSDIASHFMWSMEPMPAPDRWKKLAADWLGRQGVHFQKEMVLAVFKGTSSGSSKYAVRKVAVVGGKEIRVYIEFVRGETRDIGYPYDLVACPQRDLPVVFHENGKEVARVPFKPAEDKELAGFLEEIRHCTAAGTAEAKSVERSGSGRPRHPWTVGFQVDTVTGLYGEQAAETVALANMWVEPKFKAGEKILWCSQTWKVNETTDNTASFAIKWSPDREEATKFALAPGWWRNSKCPFCLLSKAKSFHRGKCPHCAKDIHGSGALPKRCMNCAVLMGRCWNCDRVVGPATRGVKLLLGTLDPLRETADVDPMKLTVAAGKTPELWVAAKLAGDVKEVSELQCHEGNLRYCHSLFCLVTGPGEAEHRVVCFPDNKRTTDLVKLAPLAASASARNWLQLRDSAGQPVFEQPGAYTVRAVAGRLVSNPVTVVIGGEGSVPGVAPGRPSPGTIAPPRQPDPVVTPAEAAAAEAKKIMAHAEMRRERAMTILGKGGRQEDIAKDLAELRGFADRLTQLGRAGDAARLLEQVKEIEAAAAAKSRPGGKSGSPPEVF